MSKLQDIEKVFDFLDCGRTQSAYYIEDEINRVRQSGQTKDIRFKYFYINVFKKGTVHIHFTNPALLQKFNMYVGLRREWLPPHFGKTSYEDMPAEEQEVINEFCGRKQYEEICEKQDYYLTNNQPLLLAEV